MPVTTVLSVNPNTDCHRLLDIHRGSSVVGLSDLKRYFHHYGYLPATDKNFTDNFDDQFESAVTLYQSKLGLPLTGRLNSTTLSQVMSPRCGVPENHNHKLHTSKHYSLAEGRPTWNHSTPMTLYYAFSPIHMINYVKLSDIRVAFRRAFSKWSSVIPVNFTETQDYEHANITIGFYDKDHGDGFPFDGVLAHAFGPGLGMIHFNAAITWAVDFRSEKSQKAFDLESVATHEIGHVLGLDHSSIHEAVMWPSTPPRTISAGLTLDDVTGAQALYGSNPNFNLDSLKVKNSAGKSFGSREIITISISLVVKALFL
ncbi:metalloendoproteinase 1-MMP-like [Papaver somniferum]|nr:metalloendoproteinase 1-MMP-like [Papaver somniferum]